MLLLLLLSKIKFDGMFHILVFSATVPKLSRHYFHVGQLYAFVQALADQSIGRGHFYPVILQADQNIRKVIWVIFGLYFKTFTTITCNLFRELVAYSPEFQLILAKGSSPIPIYIRKQSEFERGVGDDPGARQCIEFGGGSVPARLGRL